MPKRDFIANIDDANAEVQRLADENAQLTIDKTTLTGQVAEITTLRQQLTQKDADINAKDTEINTLKGSITTKDADITRLQGEVQVEKTRATKQIAAAGAEPHTTENPANTPGGEDPLKGLTGLARATKANEIRIAAGNKKF